MANGHMTEMTGEQIGNYRLMRLLGSGGFADVYLGEHRHLGTHVAIKVLHTKLESAQAERFRVEARTMAHLTHAHIVRVFDFDVQNGSPYLVMDYAAGGTLRQRHPKDSTVPLPVVVDYIKQIASALDYAHSQKFIHRDVKPENMLIMQDERIVLSDFGVASIAHSTQSQMPIELAGTIFYIAPEQIKGKPRTSSDQYALGVVVYEWLSGQRPFQGSFGEIASQQLLASPASLYNSNRRIAGISEAIENVIFTALAKDSRARFGSIQAFASAFEQASQGGYTIVPLPAVQDGASSTHDEDEDGTSPSHAIPARSMDGNTASSPGGLLDPLQTTPVPDALDATSVAPMPTTPEKTSTLLAKPEQSEATTVPLPPIHREYRAQRKAFVPQLRPMRTSHLYSRRNVFIVCTLVSLLIVFIFSSVLYASTANSQPHAVQINVAGSTATLTVSTPTVVPSATPPLKKVLPANIVTPTANVLPVVQPGDTPTAESATPPAEPPAPTPTAVPPVPVQPTTVAPAPPPPAPVVCPPTIQTGSKGAWVKTLQTSLNARYGSHDFPNAPHNFSPPLVVDADFGVLTQAAVKDFQQAHHIQIDGSVGPQTWHTLGNC